MIFLRRPLSSTRWTRQYRRELLGPAGYLSKIRRGESSTAAAGRARRPSVPGLAGPPPLYKGLISALHAIPRTGW
jgi:hypothetical protein